MMDCGHSYTATLERTQDAATRISINSDTAEVARAEIVEGREGVYLNIGRVGGSAGASSDALMQAIFDLPEIHRARKIMACLPLGETELLDGLRSHCDDVRTRSAGGSCLFDGRVRRPGAGRLS